MCVFDLYLQIADFFAIRAADQSNLRDMPNICAAASTAGIRHWP
jgi:hypothetical protein